MEKNLNEYQRPFMQEDTWTGLIQEWLNHTTSDVVWVQQIYNEALKEFGKSRNSEAREIGQIMNGTISGWKTYTNPRNIPGYGKQRGWMRGKQTPETKCKHLFRWGERRWRFLLKADNKGILENLS